MAISTGGLGRPGGLLPTGGLGRREVTTTGPGSTLAGLGSLTGSLTAVGHLAATLAGAGGLTADLSPAGVSAGPNLAEASVGGRLVFT